MTDAVLAVPPVSSTPPARPAPFADEGADAEAFGREIDQAKSRLLVPQLAAAQDTSETKTPMIAVVPLTPAASFLARNAAYAFRVGSTTHNIAWPDNPSTADVLKYGFNGTSSTERSESLNVRIVKVAQVSAGQTAKIYEEHRGGPAMLEISYSGTLGVGGKTGNNVEYNIVDPRKKTFDQDAKHTTTFAEVIGRTHQFGLERRREYQFSNKGEAERFLDDFQQKQPVGAKFSPTQLLPDAWVRSELDKAYEQYAQSRGLPSGASGGELSAHWSPVALKAYGSTGFDGLKKYTDKIGLNVSPESNMLTNVLLYGAGAWAEVGGSVDLAAKYTWDNADISKITVQTEDLDPGAPGAIIFEGKADYRLFGALSFGHYPVVTGLSEGTYIGGAGIILDEHAMPVQTIVSYEGHLKHLTPGAEQRFRDIRYNNIDGKLGLQGTYSDLDISRTAAKFEIRGDLWTDKPAEALSYQFQSEMAHAGPHRRFDEINREMGAASPFVNKQWESDARRRYETNIAKKPVSEQDWAEILHENLTDRWYEVLPSLGRETRNWQKQFFTDDKKQAYAQWDGISGRLVAKYDNDLKQMSEPQIYQAYQDLGLRHPGVYIGIHEGTKHENTVSGGVWVGDRTPAVPGAPARSASKNPYGLTKVIHRSEDGTYHQSGSLAISHPAFAHAEKILDDPRAAPAFIALMNRSAYPRKAPDGTPLQINPAARLMYRGFTPTREIDRALEETGLKTSGRIGELNRLPGIYQVRQGETFAEIGQRALQKLTSQPVTADEGRIYGKLVQDMNFPGMSDQAAASHIFDGAFILLPSR
jgi:hypothetical protein